MGPSGTSAARAFIVRLIIFGPPGVGKGTQATRLVERYSVSHVSTGDVFRQQVREGTTRGVKVRDYLDRGVLVPDDIVGEMIEVRLAQADCADGFILDGFPRTLAQAKILDGLMRYQHVTLDAAVVLNADDDTIVERISGRRVCPICDRSFHVEFAPTRVPGRCDDDGKELEQRPDDRPDAVRKRLQVYAAETAPLREYYQEQGVLIEIDGSNDPDKVASDTVASIDELTSE